MRRGVVAAMYDRYLVPYRSDEDGGRATYVAGVPIGEAE